MPTLNYSDLFGSDSNNLRVPQGTESMTAYEAALAWTEGGFYVLPINNESKHAGSVVGNGWPEKSSIDPEQIKAWFDGKEHGLAIHVGRSGAICFDVDDSSCLPYKLRQWLTFDGTPFQSTRTDDPIRGHYLFATQAGTVYGNSKGYLRGGWGEVRGKNGIVVVAPTIHAKHSSGGQYKWLRTGNLPYLPFELQQLLPEMTVDRVPAIDLRLAEDFFLLHTESLLPSLLELRLFESRVNFRSGSRHDAARNLLVHCLLESMAGLYDARSTVESIANVFIEFKPQSEWTSPSEFIDMTRWAIAQIIDTGDTELESIKETQLLLASPKVKEWIEGNND